MHVYIAMRACKKDSERDLTLTIIVCDIVVRCNIPLFYEREPEDLLKLHTVTYR